MLWILLMWWIIRLIRKLKRNCRGMLFIPAKDAKTHASWTPTIPTFISSEKRTSIHRIRSIWICISRWIGRGFEHFSRRIVIRRKTNSSAKSTANSSTVPTHNHHNTKTISSEIIIKETHWMWKRRMRIRNMIRIIRSSFRRLLATPDGTSTTTKPSPPTNTSNNSKPTKN